MGRDTRALRVGHHDLDQREADHKRCRSRDDNQRRLRAVDESGAAVARAHLDKVRTYRLQGCICGLHEALEVDVQELKHEVQLLIGMDDIKQPVSKAIEHESVEWWYVHAHRTIFSSFSSFRSDISRIAVEGTPSSSASRRIFFNATISLFPTSRAL
jgi:hypothetical protein